MRVITTVTVLVILFSIGPSTGHNDGIESGTISIPSINLHSELERSRINYHRGVDGWAWYWTVPRHNVGWHPEGFQVSMVGHTPGIFAELTKLDIGDKILVDLGRNGLTRSYFVQETFKISADEYAARYRELYDASSDRLMLLTCQTRDFRWIVIAYPGRQHVATRISTR